MVEREAGYAIPAGESWRLEPGGAHIMLFGLDRTPQVGEAVPLVLTFERAGEMTIEAVVRER